jgi:3-dehydroquinate synthase
MVQAWGTLLLVLTRALPVVAEASVLLFGLHQLSWRRFLPPVVLSNLGIALAYSAFGDWARQHAWLPLALGVSVALPLLLAAFIRRWFKDPFAAGR